MATCQKSITIGRAPENDCIVNDFYVNKVHYRIDRIEWNRFLITDLDTVNGTYVNGERVLGSKEIGPYAEVKVGNTQVPWVHHFSIPGPPDLPYPPPTPLGGCIYDPPIKRLWPWILLGVMTFLIVYLLLK